MSTLVEKHPFNLLHSTDVQINSPPTKETITDIVGLSLTSTKSTQQTSKNDREITRSTPGLKLF